MAVNRDQAEKIAALVEALRPDWKAPGVMDNLKPIAHLDPFNAAMRAIRAAADVKARTPGVISKDGPHCYEVLVKPTSAGPKPHEECGTHPGQYRLSCGGCRADKIAERTPEPDAPPLSAEEARRLCREAAAAAKRKPNHKETST